MVSTAPVAAPPQQETYRVEPHRWQTRRWARVARRIGRHWVSSRHLRRYCDPYVVDGREALRGFDGPALIIVNHTSHFDTLVAIDVLRERIRSRTAVAAAADKFYRRSKRGWWYSLFYNAFPIERRGGGAATLDYPLSLLKRGWSVLIYPEGTRSTTGEMGEFHHGVSVLALRARVPVIPIYTQGLGAVMPKGQRSPAPAPVHARIGPPISLSDADSVPAATAVLQRAMQALAEQTGRLSTRDFALAPDAAAKCHASAPRHTRRRPTRVLRLLSNARRG